MFAEMARRGWLSGKCVVMSLWDGAVERGSLAASGDPQETARAQHEEFCHYVPLPLAMFLTMNLLRHYILK